MKSQDSSRTVSPKELSCHEHSVLKVLWQHFACRMFDDDQLNALQLPRLSGAEVLAAFLSLRQKGWIGAIKKGWGERLYFIPAELLPDVQEMFCSIHPLTDTPAPSKIVQEAKPGITIDLFNVLVYIRSCNGLPLTSRGTVYKKHILKLQEPHQGLTDEDIMPMDIQYEHSEVYPPRTAVLLDLGFSIGLLRLEGDALQLNQQAAEEWLQQPQASMNSFLLRRVLTRYGQGRADTDHLRFLLCHRDMPTGQWYSLDRLLEGMGAAGLVEPGRREELRTYGEAWIRFLCACGWTDFGIGQSGQLLFRWIIPAGESLRAQQAGAIHSGPCVIIQPDFDILLPPETPFAVRWKLSCCAERVADDYMSVYRLTQSSVQRAAARGICAEQLIDFLQRESMTGVPEQVVDAIVRWGRESFVEQSLLPSEALAEKYGSLAGGQGKDGLFGLGGVQGVPGLVRTDDSRIGDADKLDYDIPDPASLYPELTGIPVRWSRDWRIYHSTTAKEMMELALRWRTGIVLGIGGRQCRFIPRGLQRHPWRVTGELEDGAGPEEKPRTVELEEGGWREMRLELPF